MKKIFTAFLFSIFIWLVALGVKTGWALEFEDSEPYISLAVDKEEITAGETFDYLITFGNHGPKPAENIKITLNQPIDGRAPVIFVTSDPEPDDWFSSEYGNLPEFLIPLLNTDEATEAGIISITLEVRESAAPQILQATANLEAPKREIGKRSIVSNSVSTEIIVEGGDSGIAREATSSNESGPDKKPVESAFSVSPQPPKEEEGETLVDTLLSSEAIWSTLAFLAASSLLVIAFIAGRKSKAG